jgi:hypothetical protein
MRLLAYRISPDARIEPASTRREWMDKWPSKHPYHCLPLAVANSYGWQLICERSFDAVWDGGSAKRSVRVMPIGVGNGRPAYSKFGHGTLTFGSGCIIRTDCPVQLFVTGPLNVLKHGVGALSAIVDTSWLPFPFTMNWRFTAPDVVVRFDEGEPFCHFLPLAPTLIDDLSPEWRDLASDSTLWRRYHEYKLARQISNGLRFTPDGAVETGEHYYQHFYQDGTSANGECLAARPRRRYTVKPFVDFSTSGLERLDLSSSQGDSTVANSTE